MKKSITLSILSLALFSACSKNNSESEIDSNEIAESNFNPTLSIEEQIMSIPNNDFTNPSLITSYSEVMKEVLTLSKDSEFRNYIYATSKKQSDAGDDYIVQINQVSKSLIGKGDKFNKSANKLATLSSKIQEINSDIVPMVFFPKAETLEDNTKQNKGYSVEKNMAEPIAVFKGAYNDDYSAPAYKLNNEGNLEYVKMINEDYAWNNDVYVIGNSENISYYKNPCDIMKSADCYGSSGGTGGIINYTDPNKRLNGRAEYGGKIKITSNLNEIEHWLSGKLEMRMIVTGVQGSIGTVISDIPFAKVKRKHFKDGKWYDYKAFLFNWNLSNLGDYNIEKWIERDGGSTAELTISIPGSSYKPATSTTPAQPAFPGTTVKVSAKRDDDDLGTKLVQFSDNLSQEYNLGKMNFVRK